MQCLNDETEYIQNEEYSDEYSDTDYFAEYELAEGFTSSPVQMKSQIEYTVNIDDYTDEKTMKIDICTNTRR